MMIRTVCTTTLTLVSVAAAAQTTTTTTRCVESYYSGHVCTTTTTGPVEDAPAHKPSKSEEARLRRESDERYEAWQAFCKPQSVTGADGLTRKIYAHPNCDMGRVK